MKRTLQFLLVAALAIPAFAKSGDALSLVPTNAVSVGVIKIGDLRTSPLSSILFQHTDKVSTNGEADKFLTDAGLDPKKDVDVLVVATSPKTTFGSDADVLVAAEGRFNVERLSTALASRGAVKKTAGNVTYYTTPKEEGNNGKGAVAFVNSGLTLMGTEAAVLAALTAHANGGTNFKASNLGIESARIDAGATAWAIVDVIRAKRLTGTGPNTKHNRNEALNAAIKNVSTVALWAKDTGDALELDAFGLTNDGDTLQLLEDTLRGALAAARLAVQDKAPDMVSVLRRFSVSRTDDAIKISGSIPAEALRKLMAQKHAAK